MTSSQSAAATDERKPISELHIEFDAQQLTVRTDSPGIAEFLVDAYSLMMVPRPTNSIGRLDIMSNGISFSVRGIREVDYGAPLAYLSDSMVAEVLYQFISVRQDLMWVHAGCVESAGKAMLFAGPSGNGKSTLVTLLCDRGWRFLSDDIAPIRMNLDEVLPFPQAPRRRMNPGREVAADEMRLLERESIEVDAKRIQREPTAIGGIVFPVFRAGVAPQLDRVPAGEAALKLIRDCTNFADHKAAAVARAVAMARTIPVYGLTYSEGRDAAILFDALR